MSYIENFLALSQVSRTQCHKIRCLWNSLFDTDKGLVQYMMASLCIPRACALPFAGVGALQHPTRFDSQDGLQSPGIRQYTSALLHILTMKTDGRNVFGSAMASQYRDISQHDDSDDPEQMTTALLLGPSARQRGQVEKKKSVKQPLEETDSRTSVAPLSDMEVENLVKRISESVVIRDVPVKNPQWIQVPKGYLMDLELQPSEFFKSRTDFKDQVKKRKREATLPKWSGRGWQNHLRGFRPEEVNWNGALCMDDCQESNLKNKIHPLFDRSCFDDTPDAIYDQLVPALQLATLFLTQPICMQFWVTLAMGERKTDTEMSAKNGKLSQRINSHVKLTAERARTVIKYLNDVGTSKLIHYRFNRALESGHQKSAFAISQPICDYKGLDGECHNVKSSLVSSIIRFHTDYYIAAKKLSQLKFQEVSQKLRFSFGFAVLIIHEIAHSIEGIHFRERDQQWLDWHSSQYYKEPYWLDWNESECGRAWEETMFGGHLQPINRRVDGSHGIAIADWPFGGTEEDPQNYRWWTVSMDYIEHMFQMSTWQRQFDLKDWRIFNVPRDGATSLYINSFSTMKPSEEERVAKEEVAELIAHSKEEPAKKKRETALGDAEEYRDDEEEVIEQIVEKGSQQSPETVIHRQVPMFHGTRRLSSVMSGPLPDDEINVVNRPILMPHSRKTSLGRRQGEEAQGAKASTKTPSQVALGKQPLPSNGLSARQREFLEEQRRKDAERGLSDKAAEQMRAVDHLEGKESTSEVIKQVKTKPKSKGILQRYKEKTRAKITQEPIINDEAPAIAEATVPEKVDSLEAGTAFVEGEDSKQKPSPMESLTEGEKSDDEPVEQVDTDEDAVAETRQD